MTNSLKIITLAVFLSGCSSIPMCGTKSLQMQFPSMVPYFGSNPLIIERTNDHVDCKLDPEERTLNGS